MMHFQAIKAGHSGFVTAVANYDPSNSDTTAGKNKIFVDYWSR